MYHIKIQKFDLLFATWGDRDATFATIFDSTQLCFGLSYLKFATQLPLLATILVISYFSLIRKIRRNMMR
jgi:hypothetical protein